MIHFSINKNRMFASDDRKGLEKSQSFCASLAPILDEADVSPLRPDVTMEHAMCPPVIRNSDVTNSNP